MAQIDDLVAGFHNHKKKSLTKSTIIINASLNLVQNKLELPNKRRISINSTSKRFNARYKTKFCRICSEYLKHVRHCFYLVWSIKRAYKHQKKNGKPEFFFGSWFRFFSRLFCCFRHLINTCNRSLALVSGVATSLLHGQRSWLWKWCANVRGICCAQIGGSVSEADMGDTVGCSGMSRLWLRLCLRTINHAWVISPGYAVAGKFVI